MGFTVPVIVASVMALAIPTRAALATTTHYSDGLQGACGCGTEAGTYDWQYGISGQVYTAAANQALFDLGGMEHWCGGGCGKCYRLTSTGVSTCETCGEGGEQGKSITVMVTNLCPFAGNEQWCHNPGSLNPAGYEYHFDIMGGQGVFGDNVVVEFEEVACPGDAGFRWKTCECHPDLRGKDLAAGGHEAGAGVVGPEVAAVISVNGLVARGEATALPSGAASSAGVSPASSSAVETPSTMLTQTSTPVSASSSPSLLPRSPLTPEEMEDEARWDAEEDVAPIEDGDWEPPETPSPAACPCPSASPSPSSSASLLPRSPLTPEEMEDEARWDAEEDVAPVEDGDWEPPEMPSPAACPCLSASPSSSPSSSAVVQAQSTMVTSASLSPSSSVV